MKRVLLVVDMLNDFIHEDGVLSLKEAGHGIVPVIKQKIVDYKEGEDYVIHICDSHEPDDKEFERFPPHAVVGTWGAEVVDELTPDGSEMIIKKQRYSGFYKTGLDAILKSIDPCEIEVVGCCTSICVFFTVMDLANRDYKIVIDKDAVADFNKEAGEFSLTHMKNIGGVEII